MSNRLEELQSTNEEYRLASSKEHIRLGEELSQSIEDVRHHIKTSSAKTQENFSNSIRETEQMLKAYSKNLSRVQMETAILRNLFFPSMFDRESNMSTAGSGTFEWIFGCDQSDASSSNSQSDDDYDASSVETSMPNSDDDVDVSSDENGAGSVGEMSPASASPETTHRHKAKDPNIDPREQGELQIQKRARVQASKAFQNWLIASNGIFHISGSAGSGKSTLMRFLCDHEETTNLLYEWAGNGNLVSAAFYFWRAGDQMQSSLQGLYRSILFEVLRARTDLIPSIFPTEWNLLERSKSIIDGAFLNAKTIQQAFGRLTNYGGDMRYRFCFFIDGLDEYDADSVDHMQLAEMLLRWSNHENIKICVSSRPYNEFMFTFCDSEKRRIHLHDLNCGDIYVFTRRMFQNDRNIDYLGSDYLELVYRIVESSQGVFLWAVLVVRSIIAGLLRRDSLRSLKKKLDSTPKDLNRLYQQLFQSMDDSDRRKATLMLLLATLKPRYHRLTVVQLYWTEELQDQDFPPLNGIRPRPWLSLEETIERAERQIAGITRGLLQIIGPSSRRTDRFEIPEVQFLHRSVEDYIHGEAKDAKMMRLIDKDTYVRLWIAEMTLMESPFRRQYWSEIEPRLPVEDFEEVSFHLLDTIRDLLTPEPLDGNPAADTDPSTLVYCGAATSGLLLIHRFRQGQVSFICYAAKHRQKGYVAREIGKSESKHRQDYDPNLLLSVAIGNFMGTGHSRLDMVEMVLSNGFSPAFCVQTYEYNPDFGGPYRPWAPLIPIWMIVLSYVIQNIFVHWNVITENGVFSDGYLAERWQILELILGHPDINPGDAHFILASESNKGEFESLHVSQLIERFNDPKTAPMQVILTKQGPSTATMSSGLPEYASRDTELLSAKFDFRDCLSTILAHGNPLKEFCKFDDKIIVGLISGEHFLPVHWYARIM